MNSRKWQPIRVHNALKQAMFKTKRIIQYFFRYNLSYLGLIKGFVGRQVIHLQIRLVNEILSIFAPTRFEIYTLFIIACVLS